MRCMNSLNKFLAFASLVLLTSCNPQQSSKVTAQADQLASMNQRMTALEGRISALELTVQTQQMEAGNWTLWQVTEGTHAGYPQAFSAYASRSDCLTAAGGWSFPGTRS